MAPTQRKNFIQILRPSNYLFTYLIVIFFAFIMRFNKGNRFAIVDKDIDRLKEQQQIKRSSSTKLNHDPTDTQIKKS